MFIRDDEDKGDKPSKTDTLFSMAEYCQVFLTAHYIKNGEDDEFIPLIERDKLDRMPKAVAGEMDLIFQMAVKELEKWGERPEEFFQMEIGEIDPVYDFIDTTEMRNALGNVVMRRHVSRTVFVMKKPLKRQNLARDADKLHEFVSRLCLAIRMWLRT